jgi:hypothetical protein
MPLADLSFKLIASVNARTSARRRVMRHRLVRVALPDVAAEEPPEGRTLILSTSFAGRWRRVARPRRHRSMCRFRW